MGLKNNIETFDSLGDNHVGTSSETPMRPDAFILSEEEKINMIKQDVQHIMETLGLDLEILRPLVLEMSKKIRHRGPDWSGIYSDDKTVMAHERLAIVDPASGKQPLFSEDQKLILANVTLQWYFVNFETSKSKLHS